MSNRVVADQPYTNDLLPNWSKDLAWILRKKNPPEYGSEMHLTLAPLFVLTGYGSFAAAIMLLSAFGGVWFYGSIREKLPH